LEAPRRRSFNEGVGEERLVAAGESSDTGATGTRPTTGKKPDPCASVVGFLSRVHMGPV
jgi:hypothetical protein